MKVKFGLRNVVYAKATFDVETNAYTYDTPKKIPGGVNLSLSPTGDSSDFYADDVIYFSDNTNQGYEGDLEIALVPESFLTEILGEEKDSNGALIENSEAITSPFALGFEVQGDTKQRRTWLYNCTAARPNQDAKTKESSKSPSTETLSIKSMPRLSDKAVKAVLEQTDENKDVFEKFFESVYERTTTTV